MAENELATIKLFRFDPEVDSEPRYYEFKAPYKDRTVLDVLRYIYENLDSTFAFRSACTKGFCRSCVISLNGRPALGCMEPATPNMTIEPHPKFKVIKDIVVDFNKSD